MIKKGENVTIPAVDGFSLSATLFAPEASSESVAIISAAMAVPRRFYKIYARHLALQGHLAVTYDYRGIGDSRPAVLKGFRARMRDWAELDMAGVIEWVTNQYQPSKIVLIGHSIGGQAAGLLDNSEKVTAMVTVSAQSGYWGLQPGKEKYRGWFFGYIAFPFLSRLYGYLPWSRFASGEDMPKDVALEWASWSRSPDYLFGDKTLDSLRNFPRFTAPILAYSFEDDVWGSRRSVDNMMARYTAVEMDRRHRTTEAVGGNKIGHLGFFLPSSEALWQEADTWLEQIKSE
jgi:predicted alpha/beta hydrolase